MLIQIDFELRPDVLVITDFFTTRTDGNNAAQRFDLGK
jgi:hypothetical protein